MKVEKLVIHHSASQGRNTTKKDIEAWHKQRGFISIGYHKLIDRTGKVLLGRNEGHQGAHAKGANHNSLGVCLFGDFTKEHPSHEQITSLTQVLSKWCTQYDLNESAIFGHFNVPGGATKTLCPGPNLIAKISSIKDDVRKNLQQASSP